MQNIWKYSLLLAFSIIVDQLFKGSAQSLVDLPSAHEALFPPLYLVRSRNFLFPLSINIGLDTIWSNRLSLIMTIALLTTCFWWVIKWRNTRPLAGWSLSLISCGLFSSFMDRYSHGYALDYLGLKLSEESWINFSLGDFELCIGFILGALLFFKRKAFL